MKKFKQINQSICTNLVNEFPNHFPSFTSKRLLWGAKILNKLSKFLSNHFWSPTHNIQFSNNSYLRSYFCVTHFSNGITVQKVQFCASKCKRSISNHLSPFFFFSYCVLQPLLKNCWRSDWTFTRLIRQMAALLFFSSLACFYTVVWKQFHNKYFYNWKLFVDSLNFYLSKEIYN